MKTRPQFYTMAIIALVAVFALIGCKEDEPEEKTEQSYPVPGTKVTIKYMGFASDTEIPAEVSKLAGIFITYASIFSTIDRTIYVIDGSSAVCSIRADGTMEAGRKWIIDTSTSNLDNAILALRYSWIA